MSEFGERIVVVSQLQLNDERTDLKEGGCNDRELTEDTNENRVKAFCADYRQGDKASSRIRMTIYDVPRRVTYMAVEMTVKTYRGTRAKNGATAIKQLAKKER